jgi:hypothetical protein
MAMKCNILAVALVGIGLLSSAAAQADAMRCTSLHATCVADCRKPPNVASLSACITNCGQRRGACLRTGCWNTGTQMICNLARK